MAGKESNSTHTQKHTGGAGRRHKKNNPCEGCDYYGGCAKAVWCCNYYLITGERRQCPPGHGCTVRSASGKTKRKPMKIRANR